MEIFQFIEGTAHKMLAVHEGVEKLAEINPLAAELVKLRFFANFTIPEAADILKISPRKVNRIWSYARAWLTLELG